MIKKDEILQRINDLFIHFQIVIFIDWVLNLFIIPLFLVASKVVYLENLLLEIGLSLPHHSLVIFFIAVQEVVHRCIGHVDCDLVLLTQLKQELLHIRRKGKVVIYFVFNLFNLSNKHSFRETSQNFEKFLVEVRDYQLS